MIRDSAIGTWDLNSDAPAEPIVPHPGEASQLRRASELLEFSQVIRLAVWLPEHEFDLAQRSIDCVGPSLDRAL